MIRHRIDRWFARFRRTGDARLLARVFDATAPELWRVAVHLCRDRHTAEDALQATFLGAIEAQHDWDAARPLLPWLLGMLGNRVREQRRRMARAPDAERLTAAGERDPADVAAERETATALRAELQRLDEPYRTTLERHLVHGLAAHEIARELGVPAGTVRMRLHRGLDRLRRALPRGLVAPGAAVLALRPEVLAAMRHRVLGAVPGGAAGVGSVPTGSFAIGALLMSKLSWSVVGSAAALLLVWWAWPPPSSATAVPADVARVAAHDAGLAELQPPAATAATAPAASAAPERVEIEAAATAPDRGRLRVRVRNAGNDQPVADVWLVARGGLQRDAAEAFATAAAGSAPSVCADEAAPTRRSGTDRDGAVEFDLPVGFATIEVDGLAVRASAEVRGGEATEVSLALPVRFIADVLVLDGDDRPVAGARLVGSSDLVAFGLAADEFGRTGADGRCRVPVVARELRLRAHADGCAASASAELTKQQTKATLRLGPVPATVEGVVADGQGVALAGCTVALRPLPLRRGDVAPLIVFADDAGHFVCRDVPPGRCVALAVRLLADGSSRLVAREVDVAPGGQAFVALHFGGGASLDVRLVEAGGAPIAGADVIVSLLHDDLGDFARVATIAVTTDERGEGSVRDLLPGRYRAHVLHDGLVQREIELAAGEQGRFEHVFGAGAALDVRIVDRAGRPVEGWLVTLVTGAVGRSERSDADGRVRFADLAGDSAELKVGPDEANAALVTRAVQLGGEIEVIVDPADVGAAALRGVLAPAAGIDLEDVQVLLVRATAKPAAPIVVAVDAATGAFAAERLAAGDYALMVLGHPSHQLLAIRERITVAAGGVADLGTIAVDTGRLVVSVELPEGETVGSPFVGMTLAAASIAGATVFGELRADDGARALPEGTFELLVWGEEMAPARTTVRMRPAEENVVRVSAERAAPVTLRFDDLDAGAPVARLRVRAQDRAPFDVMRELRRSPTLVLGFAAGHHEVELDDLRGHRVAAAFTVGADLAPREVMLRRAP